MRPSLMKPVAVVMAVLVLASPLLAGRSDYARGRADGKAAAFESGAGAGGLAMLWGFLLGPIGMLIALFTAGGPPSGDLIGQPSDYALGYAEGFKAERQKWALLNSGCGCGLSALVSGLIVWATSM